MRPPLDDSIAVVTGASSGIGVELARLLAPRVKVLVLVARRQERLEALAQELREQVQRTEIEVAPADLSRPEEVEALCAHLLDEHGGVDILVNNAGLGDFDLFERCDPAKLQTMLGVNMVGLTLLTRRLLPGMVARGRGGVLNISSSFGLTWMPFFSAYLGTKHYVTAFSEALRCELGGTGVVVTQVCPGPVATEFEERAGNKTFQEVPGFLQISAERCAEASLAAFERGRALVVPGLGMKVVAFAGSWTPRWLLRLVMGGLGRYLRLEIEAWYVMQAAAEEEQRRRLRLETRGSVHEEASSG